MPINPLAQIPNEIVPNITINQNGWTPVLALVERTNDDLTTSTVFQVVDWVGGIATKPAVGSYIGEEGLVLSIDDAVDVRGTSGTIQTTVALLRLLAAPESATFYVTDLGGIFIADTADTTTADDGLFTIVTANSKRFKKRSSGNSLVITAVTDFSKVNNINSATVEWNDVDRGGVFKWYSSGYTNNNGTVFTGKTGFWVRQFSSNINPKWFGAKGDNSTDDTAAIQAANDFIEATGNSGSGVIEFPEGIYLVSLINLGVRVSIFGQGINTTRIKAINDANSDAVIQTKGYEDLVGTTSLGGSFRNIISDLTVDGNKLNDGADFGIRLYGKAFQIRNVSIESCLGTGLYTEYDGGDDFTTPEKTLEAVYANVSIQQCDGSGFEFNGPHDSVCDKLIIFAIGEWGWIVRKSISATAVNTYLCQSGGIRAYGDGAAIKGSDIIGSTAAGWGALLESGGHNMSGIFAGPIALEVRANNNIITGAIGNSTTKGLSLNGASAQGVFNIAVFNNPGIVFDVVNSTAKSVVNAVTDGTGTLQNGAFKGTWHISGSVNQNQIEGGTTIQGGKLYLPKTDLTSQGNCGIFFDTSPPSSGAFLRGDRVFNTVASPLLPKGWVCVTSGSPGTWIAQEEYFIIDSSRTVDPDKAYLNSVYGASGKGFGVYFSALSSGYKRYLKLSDSGTSDWESNTVTVIS